MGAGYLIDLGGFIVMSLLAKIKQTMHNLGISIKSLISLDRVETNQNGGFLSFGGKIAFKNLLIFKKEAWKPLTCTTLFFFCLFLVILGVGHKWDGVEIPEISVNWAEGGWLSANILEWMEKNSVIDPP